jgi:structural maintenance of chromosome 3 (chondroitin sulfate proteoglycan 6)
MKLEQEITQVSGRMTVLVGQQNQIRYSRERLLEEGTMLSNSKEKLQERIGKLEQDADELETELSGVEAKVAGYTEELSSPMTNGITHQEEQMIVNLGKEVERRRKDMIELSKRKHEVHCAWQ